MNVFGQFVEVKLSSLIYIKGLNFASPYCTVYIKHYQSNIFIQLFISMWPTNEKQYYNLQEIIQEIMVIME